MASEGKVETVIHAQNVGPEEEATYNKVLTVEEIIQLLRNGSGGEKMLLKRRGDDSPPEDKNVVMELVKKPD